MIRSNIIRNRKTGAGLSFIYSDTLVLTAKSPVVDRETFKLEPEAGVIVKALVEIKDGVDTEVEESNLVAESVSVAKVKFALSESKPAVPAKVTLPAVKAESVMLPPDKVV